jgi:hypothetical protein
MKIRWTQFGGKAGITVKRSDHATQYMPPNICCAILQFSDINKILTE